MVSRSMESRPLKSRPLKSQPIENLVNNRVDDRRRVTRKIDFRPRHNFPSAWCNREAECLQVFLVGMNGTITGDTMNTAKEKASKEKASRGENRKRVADATNAKEAEIARATVKNGLMTASI